MMKTEEQWRRELSPEAYRILREKGTEPPFTGRYYQNHETGTYHCIGCGGLLFDSKAKYDSGSGWPSFFETAKEGTIKTDVDHSHGMTRTEVRCAQCGGHLGHLFEDGPLPTGLRYCINSGALLFKPTNGK